MAGISPQEAASTFEEVERHINRELQPDLARKINAGMVLVSWIFAAGGTPRPAPLESPPYTTGAIPYVYDLCGVSVRYLPHWDTYAVGGIDLLLPYDGETLLQDVAHAASDQLTQEYIDDRQTRTRQQQ